MKYFSVFFLALLLTASIAQDACARPRSADMFEDTSWYFSSAPFLRGNGTNREDMFSAQPLFLSTSGDIFASHNQTRYYAPLDMFSGQATRPINGEDIFESTQQTHYYATQDMFDDQPIQLVSGDDLFAFVQQTRFYPGQDMFEGRLKPFIPSYSFFADRVVE